MLFHCFLFTVITRTPETILIVTYYIREATLSRKDISLNYFTWGLQVAISRCFNWTRSVLMSSPSSSYFVLQPYYVCLIWLQKGCPSSMPHYHVQDRSSNGARNGLFFSDPVLLSAKQTSGSFPSQLSVIIPGPEVSRGCWWPWVCLRPVGANFWGSTIHLR